MDIAIFNAGLGGTAPADVAAEAPQSAQAIAEVNFTAPIVGANAIAGAMAARGAGHIVLVGSITESFPLPMAPTYAATKAGLKMFAEALRHPHGQARRDGESGVAGLHRHADEPPGERSPSRS